MAKEGAVGSQLPLAWAWMSALAELGCLSGVQRYPLGVPVSVCVSVPRLGALELACEWVCGLAVRGSAC